MEDVIWLSQRTTQGFNLKFSETVTFARLSELHSRSRQDKTSLSCKLGPQLITAINIVFLMCFLSAER